MALFRRGHLLVLLAIALVAAGSADRIVAKSGDERTISFYQIHTKETLTVTYKRGGNYIPEAMKKIDWILRDWRRDESTTMSPTTIDLAWEMHRELGSQQPINIISGYRSPKTNAMLRKTRGGQAKKSQHMVGRAMDITFPDVPLKRMRYSAMIRERGGVGYYPTSGIPFVHIDSARVRAWPRMPRYELALLFPSGRTKHRPADGGSISRRDVDTAKTKYREVAIQLAQFHSDRKNPQGSSTRIATIGSPLRPDANGANPAVRKPFAVASLSAGNEALPWMKTKLPNVSLTLNRRDQSGLQAGRSLATDALPKPRPRLLAQPKLVDRSSRFSAAKPQLASLDRGKLEAFLQTAAFSPDIAASTPQLVEPPTPADRPSSGLAAAARDEIGEQTVAAGGAVGNIGAMAHLGARLAALTPDFSAIGITDMSPDEQGNGWVQAPEFDDDHPEELAYRPFPLAPLLADSAEAHDVQLSKLQHPDVAATFDMIDDEGAFAPMAFRPGRQVAQVMWAQQFQGKAVDLDALIEIDRMKSKTPIDNRAVQTSRRLSQL